MDASMHPEPVVKKIEIQSIWIDAYMFCVDAY
jgi:hypothetical protein